MMNKTGRQEIVEDILKLADKLFRQLLPAVPKEILELDITMPQLKIMVILFVRGAIRMSDLAAGLGITLATATGLIDRLVERGLVTRDSLPDDRRVVLCRLSESGQQTISKIWNSAKNRSRELLETMDTEKLLMFTDILSTMLESAEYESQENQIRSKVKSIS
jgi:DNA-binding MarR family transcriptional regulator